MTSYILSIVRKTRTLPKPVNYINCFGRREEFRVKYHKYKWRFELGNRCRVRKVILSRQRHDDLEYNGLR